MQLRRQPETELEYWAVIEELGGYRWWLNHDLADGRISDSTGELQASMASAYEIQKALVDQLGEKFGVIPLEQSPSRYDKDAPPAPEGKIYYWDWYYKMRAEARKAEYDGMICSSCPFSGGETEFINGSRIPCTVFHGLMNSLSQPFICGMVSFKLWTPEELKQNIRQQHGEEALARFEQKEHTLRKTALASLAN